MKEFANSNKQLLPEEKDVVGKLIFEHHTTDDAPHILPEELQARLHHRSEGSCAMILGRCYRYGTGTGMVYASELNKKTGQVPFKSIMRYRNMLQAAGLKMLPITISDVKIQDGSEPRPNKKKVNGSSRSTTGQTFSFELIDPTKKVIHEVDKIPLSFKALSAAYNLYLQSLGMVQLSISTIKRYYNGLFAPSKGYENGPPKLFVWFTYFFTFGKSA